MSQQWEMCRVTAVRVFDKKGDWIREEMVISFYSRTDVIQTKAPYDSWGQTLAQLGAFGWELVSVQHSTMGAAFGAQRSNEWILGRISGHGLQQGEEVDSATVVAYLKRPIEAGRHVNDAFPR